MNNSLKVRLVAGGLFLVMLFALIFTGGVAAAPTKSFTRIRPRLGVFLEYPSAAHPYLHDANRHVMLEVKWNVVEATEGVWNWSYYDNKFAPVLDQNHILIRIKNTPVWARPNGASDPECVPPKGSKWANFAAFVSMVANRYGSEAVFIWNEPDATAWNPSYVGCFGPTYADGQAYGSFVYAIYGVIKSYNPGLAIGAGETAESHSSFTNGMYSTLGDHYDVSTFHYYTAPGWNDLDRLDDWIAYHDSKNGPHEIWLTETAYKCGIWPSFCGGDFEQEQSDFLRHLQVDNIGVKLVSWYHMKDDGWAQVGMVDGTRKKPVWYMYDNIWSGWYP